MFGVKSGRCGGKLAKTTILFANLFNEYRFGTY